MKRFAGLIAGSILANGITPIAAEDVVAARNIRAGSIILATDIVTPKDQTALRRAANIVGLEAIRTFYKGQPFNENDLRTPTLVERNAIVQMEYIKGPMTISAEGRALDQGSMGDRIRVMNLFSKRVVTAVVTGIDNVKATP